MTSPHWNGEKVFVDGGVMVEDLQDLLTSFLLGQVRRVSFLPQELS